MDLGRLKVLLMVFLLAVLLVGLMPDLLASPAELADEATAERVEIGMLDPANPGGLILVTGRGNGGGEKSGAGYFGIRLLAYRPQERIEEARFVLDGVGPGSTLTWQTGFDPQVPVRLRWVRLEPHTLLAQISGPPTIHLLIELYQPFVDQNRFGNQNQRAAFLARPDRQTMLGELLIAGTNPLPRPSLMIRTEQIAESSASYRDREGFLRALLRRQQMTEPLTGRFPYSALSFDLGRQSQVSIVASIDNQIDRLEQDIKKILQNPLPAQMVKAENDAKRIQPAGSGPVAASIERLMSRLFFDRRFDPVSERVYLINRYQAAGRAGVISEVNVETMLFAAQSAPFNPAVATSTLRHILSAQLTDGRIPSSWQIDANSQRELSPGRSMLPVGGLATLRTYRATNDLELLGWAFPRLLLWNGWWFENRGDGRAWRDGNRDGLPEWGYDETLELGRLGKEQLSPAIRRRIARSESGRNIDQTGSVFNETTSTLEENSIALGSLLTLDLECLSIIARELGLTAEAERLERRHDQMRRLINDRLWDEVSGSYVDRRWNGEPVRQLAAENFLPLLAGLPDPERLKRVMGSYSQSNLISANGMTPLPITFLLYLGLRRYGRNAESSDIASLFRDSRPGSAASPLNDLLSIEELMSLDPISGLTVGSIAATQIATIERVQIGSQSLIITLGPAETTIRRDGILELEATGPVLLRGYQQKAGILSFTIETNRTVRIRIPAEKDRKVTVSLDNDILGSTSIGATASFRVPAGTHRIIAVR